MSTLATLVVKLTADASEFRQEMDGAQSFAQKLSGGLQTIGKAAIVGGIGAVTAAVGGVAAIMKSTVPLASDFQSQLVGLEIAAGASGLSFDELHDAALAVGGDTSLLGVSATGAADAMTGLYKAGLSTTEIFGDLQGYMAGTSELGGSLRAAIDLAAASELDMVQASDLAAVALATFGGELETEEERAEFVNLALNNLVQAADASVAEVSGLADALKNVGPTASSMGIGIEDTNNALAILSTRGIQGAEAGTALKSMLANMRRPTKDVQEALDELNVSLYDAEGNFVGLPNLIGQMETAFAGLTNEQRDTYSQILAGTFGMNALNTLLAEGTEGWNAMADATANAAGIQEQAEAKAATFAGKMEALDGAMETLKIQVGEAFLPAMTDVVTLFSNIADVVGPVLVDFFTNTLGPAIDMVVAFSDSFVAGLLAGKDPVDSLKGALKEIGLDTVAEVVDTVTTAVGDLWATVQPFVEEVIGWIAQNVELQDVLMAVGIVVASVVLPALAGIVASAAPVIAIGAALVGAIALIRTAWENDWGGIRTALTDFWENTGKPTLQALGDWLSVAIPAAIETAKTFWEGTLKPALETVWTFIDENIIPIIETVVDWLKVSIPAAITAAQTAWETVLKPALEIVWQFADEHLVPLFEALKELFDVGLTLALTALAGLWENVLKPALETVWDFIKTSLQPVWDTLTDAFDNAKTKILDPLSEAFDAIGEAIDGVVGWIGDLTDKIGSIKLPDWLTPGSPTPFEMGLRGIASALRDVDRTASGVFDRFPTLAPMPALASVGGSNVTRTTSYTMNVHTRATTPTVMQDFETMRALAA